MDNQEFHKTVYPLQEMLLKLSARILHDPEEAKDNVQDVYCRFLDGNDRTPQYGNTGAVAVMIARNLCYDKLKEKRMRTRFLGDHAYQLVHEEIPIDPKLESGIWEVVGKLPPDQQVIIYLREVDGMRLTKIARLLSMNTVTVRVCICRARKKIRQELLKAQLYEIRPN